VTDTTSWDLNVRMRVTLTLTQLAASLCHWIAMRKVTDTTSWIVRVTDKPPPKGENGSMSPGMSHPTTGGVRFAPPCGQSDTLGQAREFRK